MSSVRIQNLLAPQDTKKSQERALQDINATFRTWDQLDDSQQLQNIVDIAQARHQELQSKLSASHSDLSSFLAETRTSAEGHLHTAQELSLLRHSLTDELAYLSQELVSSLSDEERKPTLLEELETLHRNLKELESVKDYVQVVERVLQLSESAIDQVRSAAQITLASLSTYQSLQRFVTSVSQACAEVEDGSGAQELRLVTFLENIRARTWTDVKGVLAGPLLEAAEKIGWPMRVEYVSASPENRKTFENAFSNLLVLQSIGDKIHPSKDQTGLYPLQALVQPVSLRFKYHFEGTRQTNRIDKPEWYFTHVLNVISEHRSFADSIFQPLLSSTEFRHIHAWRELTHLLLPLPKRKLLSTLPALLPHPSLFAYTVYQALEFDRALVEGGFGLGGTSSTAEGTKEKKDGERWGVSEVVLGRVEWFGAWVEGERKFAEDEYNEIISSRDAWLIADDEGRGEEESAGRDRDYEWRPTNSARRVRTLVESVTDRYAPLPSPTHHFPFLATIQLPLLSSYHSRISSSLDAFETLSSAFVRVVPGAITLGAGGEGVKVGDARRLTGGVEGVQRLVKALVSARWVGRGMEGWGEEVFFLELWTEIHKDQSLRSRAQDNSSLPPLQRLRGEDDSPEGTIFDALVGMYAKLAERAEDMIVQQVYGEVESGLRAHWATLTSPEQNREHYDDITISPTLLGPVALLSSHLTYLQTTLPHTTTTNIYRRISSRLSTHFLQRAIMYRGRQRLTAVQGRLVQAECELWLETCRSALGASTPKARVEAPWRRLIEAGRLIGGDGEEWGKVVDVTFGVEGDGKWEGVMKESVGHCELRREEVMQVLRMREDCDR